MNTNKATKLQIVGNEPTDHTERNPGTPLDLAQINAIRINRSAIERRAATMGKRRSLKKQWQVAWLLRAISCMDLTTLAGDDTPDKVKRLCAKARQPVRQEILDALGVGQLHVTTGAVCVYHNFIETAKQALRGTNIPVAAVSTGFPAGQIPHELKVAQIEASVKAGADEIDIVVNREYVLTSQWQALYDEVADYRKACGDAHMKSIIATGELATLTNVAKASHICMMAGSDFIKTSTGKEPTNATLANSLVMVRAVRNYHEQTGVKVGFKPAGGIRTAKQALEWLILISEELGHDWLNAHLFRFGASSLLTDIERQLEHNLTGRYSADYRHPTS